MQPSALSHPRELSSVNHTTPSTSHRPRMEHPLHETPHAECDPTIEFCKLEPLDCRSPRTTHSFDYKILSDSDEDLINAFTVINFPFTPDIAELEVPLGTNPNKTQTKKSHKQARPPYPPSFSFGKPARQRHSMATKTKGVSKTKERAANTKKFSRQKRKAKTTKIVDASRKDRVAYGERKVAVDAFFQRSHKEGLIEYVVDPNLAELTWIDPHVPDSKPEPLYQWEMMRWMSSKDGTVGPVREITLLDPENFKKEFCIATSEGTMDGKTSGMTKNATQLLRDRGIRPKEMRAEQSKRATKEGKRQSDWRCHTWVFDSEEMRATLDRKAKTRADKRKKSAEKREAKRYIETAVATADTAAMSIAQPTSAPCPGSHKTVISTPRLRATKSIQSTRTVPPNTGNFARKSKASTIRKPRKAPGPRSVEPSLPVKRRNLKRTWTWAPSLDVRVTEAASDMVVVKTQAAVLGVMC